MGKLMHVNLFAIHMPQDSLDGDEVNDPSARPAGETFSYEFAGVVGIAGRQRLQAMHGAPVANRPGHDKKTDHDSDDYAGPQCRQSFGAAQKSPQQPSADNRQQHAVIRPEHDSRAEGETAANPIASTAEG